ncbi:MAG: MaoC family dehydratase N-terminal domain-containing protein [Rhodospirillales bacterium]|nr:MaoC family dehydratase N-terminal domain-containing protein [Rhodospirillales bacterium]
MTEPLEHWSRWIGRSEEQSDVIDVLRACAMQATLDVDGPPLREGDALPHLWHWLYFWSLAPHAALGPDGHAARGEFLPPIHLPRRMWAGGRITFTKPLKIGATATRQAKVADIKRKHGSSGQLVFVTIEYEIADAEGPCLKEIQDVVFREAAKPGEKLERGEAAPAVLPWRKKITPDPLLLFRYSALTFNGHRIHYDLKYATQEEGYPGLIVHGPLLATLMMELAREKVQDREITGFVYRALRPVFDTAPISIGGRNCQNGNCAELWVADSQGNLAMQARADLA